MPADTAALALHACLPRVEQNALVGRLEYRRQRTLNPGRRGAADACKTGS